MANSIGSSRTVFVGRGFGKPGDDDEHAWKMVAYVRHLPKLTPAEEQKVLTHTEEPMDHGEAPHDHSR